MTWVLAWVKTTRPTLLDLDGTGKVTFQRWLRVSSSGDDRFVRPSAESSPDDLTNRLGIASKGSFSSSWLAAQAPLRRHTSELPLGPTVRLTSRPRMHVRRMPHTHSIPAV